VRSHLDVVALSTYVEDDPLGLGFDQVYRTLHDEFPNQQIAIGELDYWSAGTTQVWWAMSPNDPTGTARRAVARQYYRAALGYDRSVGAASGGTSLPRCSHHRARRSPQLSPTCATSSPRSRHGAAIRREPHAGAVPPGEFQRRPPLCTLHALNHRR